MINLDIPTIETIKLQIKNGIISRHPLIRNFAAGSMLDIIGEVFATQIYLQYLRTSESTESVSILTATGSDLDALVVDRLPNGRQAGTQATGNLTFKCTYAATEVIPIPLGSKALALGSDGSKQYFQTTSYGQIEIGSYSIIIEAQAVEPGTNGNVAAYSITQLPYAIEGVDRVENASAFADGTDEETDDELRNRYYYAVLVPGKATTEIIEEHLTDLEDVSEAHVYPRSYGDIEVIADYDSGTGADSTDIYDVLVADVAAGVICRGILGSTVVSGVITTNLAESSGGRIWVRATNHALAGDSLTLTYTDILGRTRTAIATIPINTVRGDTIETVLEATTDRAVSIDDISYAGIGSYDILIGMGTYPYLYVLPRTVSVDVTISISQTTTPETDLADSIQASVEAFLNAYTIGKDLEWSDLFLYIYMDYATSRMFEGIDTVESCIITGDGTSISTTGGLINIDEDERIRAGTVTVSVV